MFIYYHLVKSTVWLTKTQSSSEFNNVARLANSRLAAPTDLLHALHVVAMGQPIPNFPATSAARSALTGQSSFDGASNTAIRLYTNFEIGPTLTAILQALGADVGGTVQEKKRRLRAYVGLPPNPA